MQKHESAAMVFASLGDYRLPVMQEVRRVLGGRVAIYTGNAAYDRTIRLLDPSLINARVVHNTYLPGHLLLQRLPYWRLLRVDSLLLDMNPRVPHVWILAILRRLAGKHTALWGHAWPRGGRLSRTTKLRTILQRQASSLLTYTHTQARELQVEHHRKRVFAAPNALLKRTEMTFDSDADRDSVIYSGRLVREKKPALLLKAFAQLAEDYPEMRLIYLGAGPEDQSLREQASRLGIDGRVEFHGHVTDSTQLRRQYSRSVVSVSPGYVGLSLIQSLSYGVPMIVASDDPHSPEIEAAQEGFNCLFFRSDQSSDLTEQLRRVLTDRETWAGRGQVIAQAAAENYSVESMADGILRAMAVPS